MIKVHVSVTFPADLSYRTPRVGPARTVGLRIADEYGLGRMHLALGHSRGGLAETYGPVSALKLAREAIEW